MSLDGKAPASRWLWNAKISRSDFLADANKPFRLKPEEGLGSRRFYMAPAGLDCA